MSIRRVVGVLCALALGLAGVGVAQADNIPITDPLPDILPSTIKVKVELIADGLASPNGLTHNGDGSGRLFVTDQDGRIHLIDGGSLAGIPFADFGISGNLGTDSLLTGAGGTERGLLGLAFHPDFNDSTKAGYRKLYVYTSVTRTLNTDFDDGLTNNPLDPTPRTNHQSVIYEFQADSLNPNVIDYSTRREVVRIDQPQSNHNGGMLDFGPDGYLYVALGDGGSADDQGNGHPAPSIDNPNGGNGQDPNTILGTILRIDPLAPALTVGSSDAISANGSYRVPISNPFVGGAGLDEIFAWGLRNPFRFSFDEMTSSLIIADVGQNHIEEVNVINYLTDGGANFGWNVKEGTFLFDPNGAGNGFVYADSPGDPVNMVDPVLQYDHGDGLAVIGGYIYRGTEIPELYGKYIFGDFTAADFSTGRLFVGDLETGLIEELLIGEDSLPLGYYIKGFGVDSLGELYILASASTGFGGTGGVVLKLTAVPEPGTLALLAMAAVSAIRRPRAKRALRGDGVG